MGQNLIILGDPLLIVLWKYFREHQQKNFCHPLADFGQVGGGGGGGGGGGWLNALKKKNLWR